MKRDKSMEILTGKMKKRMRVSSPELDILPSFKRVNIQHLTEDEEYELAMKELRSLVKTKVNDHLDKMMISCKKDDSQAEKAAKKRRERMELESLIDDAFDSSKKMQS